MLTTLSGRITFVKAEQPDNTESPKMVTLSGIVMLFRAVPEKAAPPMLVTLPGIVTLVRLAQPEKQNPQER